MLTVRDGVWGRGGSHGLRAVPLQLEDVVVRAPVPDVGGQVHAVMVDLRLRYSRATKDVEAPPGAENFLRND